MKTILVIGATGAQGGSVAQHLLARGTFAVRALTRNPDSDGARLLRELGAEVVQGDLADRASIRAAMKGAYGVFGVTNYWEHFEKELDHGRNLINAVAGADIEHFVFSSLRSMRRDSGGELHVPHTDQKAFLEEYTRALGLQATFVDVAFYFENFFTWFVPRDHGDGAFRFGFPQGDTPLAGVAAEDIGGVVATIFERPNDFIGKSVGVVGDDLRGTDYAAVMSRVTGREVHYSHIPREEFARFPFKGAEDIAAMFEFNRRFIQSRRADVEQSRALYPAMQTFEQWAASRAGAFARLLA